MRIETGVTRTKDDWPGIFIRGDEAMHYAMQLGFLLERVEKTGDRDPLGTMYARGLADLLRSCAWSPETEARCQVVEMVSEEKP